MSHHTDAGELLPSDDESTILELATRLLNDSADYFETLYQRHSIDVTRRGIPSASRGTEA